MDITYNKNLIILVLIFAVGVLFWYCLLNKYDQDITENKVENFLNPYSCDLYVKALNKHLRSDMLHTRQFYEHQYYVPQYYKDY